MHGSSQTAVSLSKFENKSNIKSSSIETSNNRQDFCIAPLSCLCNIHLQYIFIASWWALHTVFTALLRHPCQKAKQSSVVAGYMQQSLKLKRFLCEPMLFPLSAADVLGEQAVVLTLVASTA